MPPKCLFPEEKDIKNIYSQSFRKNLITVPSCDAHNLAKSHDDEYLMMCLSGKVGNNGVAYVHTATKGRRAMLRKPGMLKIVKNGVLKIGEGKFPFHIVDLDVHRISHSFEAIARALYFHEEGKNFNGECRVVSRIFFHPSEKKWSNFNIRACELIESEQPDWGINTKGENPQIFTYQFGPVDGFKCQIIALTFYEKTRVFVVLSSMTKEEIEKIKPKFKFINKIIFGDLE